VPFVDLDRYVGKWYEIASDPTPLNEGCTATTAEYTARDDGTIGDVNSPQDAEAMFERTGCAGVMIGRAALKDPWIFRDTHTYLTTGRIPQPPTLQERLALMNRHFELLLKLRGEHKACVSFRQRVTWYAKRFPPCAPFKDKMRRLSSADEYRQVVSAFPGSWD
jgi:tRNA-dihydrouridine synthase